jgi:hypothetical protein
VCAVLALGVGLRLRGLGQGSLFIDEAESCLNALTILENGYPTDSYLGLPLFENTLTEPWPESEEYEFRDTSYSSRGMAIYHGWLPLYAIAVSLALHGIRPDVLTDPPRFRRGQAEIETRIRAARLPAVLFGALFLVAIFLAGRELHGVETGLAAMLFAALLPKCVWLAQQARYYSAALALSTLAVALAWRVARHGRWRDFLAAALVLVLLFHTSSLSFAIVLGACAVLLPGALRHERARWKLLGGAALVALGLVPWMLWTGYLEHLGRIPMARALLAFPDDYLIYFNGRRQRVLVGAGLLAILLVLWRLRARLPERLGSLVTGLGPPAIFLTVWILAAYFGFQLLVPAASCSMSRLAHVLVAAPLLLAALGLAGTARALSPQRSTLLSLGGVLVLLAAFGRVLERQERNPYETAAVFQTVDHLRGLELAHGTRIYALPYQHFSLTYYTGLPIQSIAPVRREFLERHSGEVLILETTSRLPQPTWQALRQAASAAGAALDEAQARALVPEVHALMIRAEVEPLVRECTPALGARPAWMWRAAAELRSAAERPGRGYVDYAGDNPAMFRGHPPLPADEFWPAFFYRFVGPEGRTGARQNYAGRMREASAHLLPSTWIVLRCPPREGTARVQ